MAVCAGLALAPAPGVAQQTTDAAQPVASTIPASTAQSPTAAPASPAATEAKPVPAGNSKPVTAAPSSQPASSDLPAAATREKPSVGAQVYTGTASGLGDEVHLSRLLADHQYAELAAELDRLPETEARLYRGLLANRSNDLAGSIHLLEPLVDHLADPSTEKLARKALAEDYLRSGDWTRAAAAYQQLDSRLQHELTPDELAEIEMPRKLLLLAATAGPRLAPTVEPGDPFELQVSRNPLGLIDIPVFVDARPHTWMLDPTAPFNLIARSLAKEAGLKVSAESTTIRSLTGRPIEIYITTIPRFTVGGRLTFRNLTAFVFDDADYAFPRSRYKVQGVLGYPALAALASLTVTADATVEMVPAQPLHPVQPTPPNNAGARFYLDGDRIVVSLGEGRPDDDAPTPATATTAAGLAKSTPAERSFVVDASGQQSYLSSRYYAEHADRFEGGKLALFAIPGAESLPPQPAYLAESIDLAAGDESFTLHELQVLTQPAGLAAVDDVDGILGLDALEQLHAYTFDYRSMRFRVRPY